MRKRLKWDVIMETYFVALDQWDGESWRPVGLRHVTPRDWLDFDLVESETARTRGEPVERVGK